MCSSSFPFAFGSYLSRYQTLPGQQLFFYSPKPDYCLTACPMPVPCHCHACVGRELGSMPIPTLVEPSFEFPTVRPSPPTSSCFLGTGKERRILGFFFLITTTQCQDRFCLYLPQTYIPSSGTSSCGFPQNISPTPPCYNPVLLPDRLRSDHAWR